MGDFQISKFRGVRNPISGQICFTGVTRAVDPSGTITDITLTPIRQLGYTISDKLFLVADNTSIYNNTTTGATYNNVSAFIIGFKLNYPDTKKIPVVTTSVSLNPTGTADAILNQILPFVLETSSSSCVVGYSVVVFGASQTDSNDLVEAVFTESTVFGFPTNSCMNFMLTFN